MGFTRHHRQHSDFTQHEWSLIKEFTWTAILAFCKEYKTGITIEYVDDDRIHLNGQEEEAYETFEIHRKQGYKFCKTNREPYDTLVGAILLYMTRVNANKLVMRADGDNEDNVSEEWNEPFLLVSKILVSTPLHLEYDDMTGVRLKGE